MVPLERDKKLNWLNVLYMSPTGREVLGWLPLKYVDDIHLGGKRVPFTDYPITQYDYLNRMEVEELIRLGGTQNLGGAKSGAGCAGGFVALVGLAMFLLSLAGLETSRGSGDTWPALLFFGGIIMLFGVAAGSGSGAGGEVRYLKTLHASLKSDREFQREMQARNAAFGLATNLITKAAPDYNNIAGWFDNR